MIVTSLQHSHISCRDPYVTGTSVLAITYKDGVMMACDTLGAYGATKRYKSFERIRKVNNSCVLAAGGELSDFQYIMRPVWDGVILCVGVFGGGGGGGAWLAVASQQACLPACQQRVVLSTYCACACTCLPSAGCCRSWWTTISAWMTVTA
jgi:hypothetical protein